MALVNDTTGTLMSCAHKNRECRVSYDEDLQIKSVILTQFLS